ncbi:hypothetical protein HUJ04_007135 [Dendroctonus ponderosae]|nr:hypothetical protein HUJ04_007135 [Dendroctonus ponderosae]
MQSDEGECELETQKEQIILRLEELKKEVQTILDTVDMIPNRNTKLPANALSKNVEVQSNNAQVVLFENAELLLKPEMEEVICSGDTR